MSSSAVGKNHVRKTRQAPAIVSRAPTTSSPEPAQTAPRPTGSGSTTRHGRPRSRRARLFRTSRPIRTPMPVRCCATCSSCRAMRCMKRHLRASTRRTSVVHALECKPALKNLLRKNCVWTDEHSSGHWAVFSAGRCRLRGWRVPSNTKALRAVSSSCPLTRSPDPPAGGATAGSSGRRPWRS